MERNGVVRLGDHLKERLFARRLRRRDPEALRRLYEMYRNHLYYSVILPRVGDEEKAKDLLAETFRKAMENIESFRVKGKGLVAWLSTIARNTCRDHGRSLARRGVFLPQFQTYVEVFRAGERDLEQRLSQQEEQRRLRVAIDEVMAQLRPRYRQALELRLIQELERQQCAQLMNVTIGNFDVIYLRAVRAFRQRWRDTFG